MAHAEATQAATGEVAPPRRRALAAGLETWLGMLVEIPAALLVVAEVFTLFAGVVARYGLQRPLIWSDELASILFLWLAMLGAAVAFRRSEHMRMTAVVANATPAMRAYLDVVATCAALAFLLLIVGPAYQYAYEESFITTPALQISNTWRAAALPVGICLMALFALLRLVRVGDSQARAGRGAFGRFADQRFLAGDAVAASARQPQSDHFLRRRGRLLRLCRGTDRLRVRTCGFWLPGADHAHAADGAGRTHGRGHEPPDPAGGAAVHLPRVADRDGRHGARDGGVSGKSARPCARRPALRAGWRDVSGFGHIRLESRRHGGGGAGAVSGNETARRHAPAISLRCSRPPARRPKPSRRASC